MWKITRCALEEVGTLRSKTLCNAFVSNTQSYIQRRWHTIAAIEKDNRIKATKTQNRTLNVGDARHAHQRAETFKVMANTLPPLIGYHFIVHSQTNCLKTLSRAPKETPFTIYRITLPDNKRDAMRLFDFQ